MNTSMTPEQKIIIIAEFDGYKPCPETRVWYALGPDEILAGYKDGIVAPIPPYLTSRDAICGAVARLDDVRLREYAKNLQEVCRQYCVGVVPDYQHDLRSLAKLTLATPAQLADALLLTLGYEI